MSRSIVCGIDDSAEARRAAELALTLANALDADPILVHAVDHRPTLPYGNFPLRKRQRGQALGPGAGLVARIDPRGEAEERILRERPERALARVAIETDAMLVAIGSRGRGPLRSTLFGSTSRATLRAAERPVLVVPPPAAEASVHARTIVCGVDGSDASDYAIAAAAELGKRLHLELVLVSVQESASLAAIPAAGVVPAVDLLELKGREEADQAVERAAAHIGESLGMRRRINVGDVATQLIATAEEEQAELIVIGASKPDADDEGLLGPISTVLCRRSPCAVLVIPEGSELERSVEAPMGGRGRQRSV